MRASTIIHGLDLATYSSLLQLHESAIHLLLRSYREETFVDLPDHLSLRDVRRHSIELEVSHGNSTWLVRVTFQAAWPRAATPIQRKTAVEHVCRHIRFDRIRLLRDTVTEIVVSTHQDIATEHPLQLNDAPVADPRMMLQYRAYYVREDPSRVRFTKHTDTNTPTVDISALTKVRQLAPGVHIARLSRDGQMYVYKTNDRPLYVPADTAMLEREFRNLQLLRGASHVVQLVAAVVSTNPYRTSKLGLDESDDLPVLRGLLLEYHPNGTLKEVASTRFPRRTSTPPPSSSEAGQKTAPASHSQWPRPWCRWARQIARGVQSLHGRSLTHLDLKPQNVVISQAGEAVLIDVSGMAVTQEYLAPELRDVVEPAALDFHTRVSNDCWALGRIVEFMANAVQDGEDADKDVLVLVATALMRDEPHARISIPEAIAQLEDK